MSALDTATAFACITAAGAFRRLADSYRRSAAEYPKYALQDLSEAERLKKQARFYVAWARRNAGPRLPA